MSRTTALALVALSLAIGRTSAQPPAPPAKTGPTATWTVACKVTRATLAPDSQGRLTNLERTTTNLPEITTLEGARGEYVSEKKIEVGVYQFKIQVQVQRLSETKVRLDVQVEDTYSEGAADRPTIHRRGLQVSRQIAPGDKLKLALDEKNGKGEGVWVELVVKEAEE
jgi:hypothetical protein